MPGRLRVVIDRFKNHDSRIEREMLKNPEFRSLCEDYGDAVEAVRNWSRSRDPSAANKTVEYRGLVLALEQEIRDHLNLVHD